MSLPQKAWTRHAVVASGKHEGSIRESFGKSRIYFFADDPTSFW
jgi:hypothetical protein